MLLRRPGGETWMMSKSVVEKMTNHVMESMERELEMFECSYLR